MDHSYNFGSAKPSKDKRYAAYKSSATDKSRKRNSRSQKKNKNKESADPGYILNI